MTRPRLPPSGPFIEVVERASVTIDVSQLVVLAPGVQTKSFPFGPVKLPPGARIVGASVQRPIAFDNVPHTQINLYLGLFSIDDLGSPGIGALGDIFPSSAPGILPVDSNLPSPFNTGSNYWRDAGGRQLVATVASNQGAPADLNTFTQGHLTADLFWTIVS